MLLQKIRQCLTKIINQKFVFKHSSFRQRSSFYFDEESLSTSLPVDQFTTHHSLLTTHYYSIILLHNYSTILFHHRLTTDNGEHTTHDSLLHNYTIILTTNKPPLGLVEFSIQWLWSIATNPSLELTGTTYYFTTILIHHFTPYAIAAIRNLFRLQVYHLI